MLKANKNEGLETPTCSRCHCLEQQYCKQQGIESK